MRYTVFSSLILLTIFGGCSTQSTAESSSESAPEQSDEETTEIDDQTAETDFPDPPPPDERTYEITEVYAEACVQCHGEDGDGDGTKQEGFSFASPADEWTNGPNVDGIVDTLDDGIHETAMQRFPEFKNEDRIELAEHVLDLRYALGADVDGD